MHCHLMPPRSADFLGFKHEAESQNCNVPANHISVNLAIRGEVIAI